MNVATKERRDAVVAFPSLKFLQSIEHWAKVKSDEVCCRFLDSQGNEEGSYTFKQLEHANRRVAVFLQQQGVKQGDRVLLAYPPGLDFVVSFIACLRAGIVAVPVYPPRPSVQSDVDRFATIQRDSGALVVLTNQQYKRYKTLEATKAKALSYFKANSKITWPSGLKWIVTDSFRIGSNDAGNFQFPNVADTDIAFLQYTSGSTSTPKGVMVSHENLTHNSHMCYIATGLHIAQLECPYQVRVFSWLPQYHDMGLIGAMVTPIHHGQSVVLMSPFSFIKSPPSWLELACKYKASVLVAPNFALRLAARKLTGYKLKHVKELDLRCIRHVLNGAEPVTIEAIDEFLKAFVPFGLSPDVVIPAYGLAEHTLIVTGGGGKRLKVDRIALENDKIVRKPDRTATELCLVGSGYSNYVAAGNVSLVIADPDTCSPVAEDTVGEIWVSSQSKTKGYFGKPEKSRESLQAQLNQGGSVNLDPNLYTKEWLRTGDLGFLHNRELFVCGRIKDLIIIHGRNLYPQDVELTVEHASGLVRPGCVAAFSLSILSSSDSGKVESFGVVAELRNGSKMKPNELEEVVKKLVEAIVTEHSVSPCNITLIQERTVPKTTSGKISRHRAKKDLTENSLATLYSWTNQHPSEQMQVSVDEVVKQSLTPTEEIVSNIWKEALELSVTAELSPDSNFFMVGGQSISAGRISIQISKQFPDLSINPNIVFEFPTIHSLGLEVDRLASETNNFTTDDRKLIRLSKEQLTDGWYPITAIQERMLFLQLLNPTQGTYNVPVSLKLKANIDLKILNSSLRVLLRQHPVLVTRYGVETNVFGNGVACGKLEWKWIEDFHVQIEHEQIFEAIKVRPFSLQTEPSIRVHFFPKTNELLLNIHHIAVDGSTVPLLLREMSRLYAQVSNDQASVSIIKSPVESYIDFAYSEHTFPVSRVQSIAFWADHIGRNPPTLKLPRDYSTTYLEQHHVETSHGRMVSQTLAPSITEYIDEVAARLSVSPFSVYLTAMQNLLMRFSGQEDVVIGVPVSNHSRNGTENMIGMFVNTVVVKATSSSQSTFERTVQNVSEFWESSRKHQGVPLQEVVKHMQTNRSRSTMFEAIFNYMDGLHTDMKIDEIERSPLVESISQTDDYNGTAKFDVSLGINHRNGEIRLVYRASMWRENSAKTFLNCFQTFLSNVQREEYKAELVTHIPILNCEEAERMNNLLNGAQVEYDRIPLMHQFFEDAVDRHPDFVALKMNGIEMTYQQVEDRANRLARYLVNELGVQVEDCVGVLFPRGCEMIITLLAILKAGGAYVPLDENYPKSRIDQIVSDSRMKICLTTRLGMDGVLLRNVEGCGIALEDIEESVFKQSSTRLDSVKVSPSNLAYVLYTSGSTGKPKGVEIEHGNVANLGQHYASRVSRSKKSELESQERELLIARLSWDVSVGSMIRAFLHNRVLCLLSVSTNVSSELESVVVAQRITHILSAPSVLTLLNPVTVPSLREIECAGDKMLPSALKRWDCTDVLIANTYGPTEATVISHDTYGTKHYSEHGMNTVPFGYARNNNYMRVLDEHGMTQPQGVVGELYIGGAQLARGYRNMPELTAKTFVKLKDDPLQRRWYKTGDLVRVLCDGQLEFMGRIANGYVKLRGYRIELGEIESVIEMHPNVAKAAVVVDEERQLMFAFVSLISTVQDDGTLEEVLRMLCVSKLTDYMIPYSFTILDEMPLDANGKLNKKSLSTLTVEALRNVSGADLVLTDLSTQMENTVAQVWAEILHVNVKDLFKESNFFQIGGHSIAAARATSQLSNVIGTTVQLALLWKHSSLAEYAETVVQLTKDSSEKGVWYPLPEQFKSHGIYPLSHVQQRMLLLQDLEPDIGTYNVPIALRLSCTVDIDRLKDAFRMLLRRHSVLVTKYDVSEQSMVHNNVQFKSMCGQIQENWIDTFKLDVVNNETDEELELLKLKPFNLREEPSIRAHFFTQSHILLVNVHHIAVDGSCLAVVIRDLVELYKTPSTLNKQVWSYIDYAHTEYETEQMLLKDEESNVSSSLKYWLDHLGRDLPVLRLPRDYSDTWIEEHNIQQSQGGSVSATIDEDLQSGVNKLSSKLSVSPFVLFLTAMEVVLHRFTAQDDVMIGVPVANRDRVEVSEMVGMFVNTVALRCQSELTETFEELVKKRDEMWIESMEHHHVPFDTVVSALSSRNTGVARSSSSPVFQAMFNYLTGIHNSSDVNRVTEQGLVEEVVSNEVEGTDGTAKFDINISVDSEKRSVHLEYRSRLWMRDTAKRFLDAFVELLRFVTTAEPTATECALVLRKIPIVRKQEQQRIERMISGQQVEYERIPLMHQFFEDAVDRHPDFVALKLNDIEMTYQQVEDHANQLARYLVNELGVKVEDCIGVLFPRGFEMIIALLAILKAGGAYVPLDENYPKSRIDQIVSDSRMKICLTTRLGMDGVLLSNVEGCGIALEDIEESVFKQSSTRLDSVKVSPSNLAYVLYTSGSTGNPKGVEMEHQSMGNFGMHLLYSYHTLKNTPKDISTTQSGNRILLTSRLSWDVSICTMLKAFTQDCVVCILHPKYGNNIATAIADEVAKGQITILDGAPSLLSVLNPGEMSTLHNVFCAGDTLIQKLESVWVTNGKQVTNYYGPTETNAMMDNFGVGRSVESGVHSIPIGIPYANVVLRVLDQHGMTQPQGVVGELYIGGAQLARGYRNMPELTAKTFVKLKDDPLQRRWYKSGDLVRVLCDGQLEFMGRIANGYVKLRGYRIELGEIESVIEMHPNVAKAAVVVDEERQLMFAFVSLISTVQDDGTLEEVLRMLCVSKLTDYMIPYSFTILDEMPLDANGKLNKKSLSTLTVEALRNVSGADLVLTDLSTQMENTVAQVWAEILHVNVKDLFKESNFFQIGGHSIAAARATSQLSNVIGTTVQLALLWKHSSLAEYAETVVQLTKDSSEKGVWYPLPEQFKSHGIYPLSHVQQRMLLLQDLEPDIGTYNVPIALRLSCTVDIDRLKDAFRMLLRRHSVLVTKYDVSEQSMVHNNVQFKSMCGQIQENWIDTFKLDVVNNETDEELELLKLKPFNLREEPSIRAHFFTQSHILLVNVHHIAVDGSCLAVVIRDLVELYKTPSTLNKQVWSYIDYAHTEYETEQMLLKDEESNVSSSLKYWLDHLGRDLPVLRLPRDYSDTWIEEHNIQQSQGGSVSATIDEDLQSGVNKLSSKLSVSPFVLFLTAMEVVLHRFTAQDDVMIGVPVANRDRVEVSEMVGMFVNTVALRCQSELTETFEELVKKRDEMWIESMEHHHVPFDTVVSALSSRNTGVARSSSSPVFQAMFNYLTGIHNSSDVNRVTEQGLVEEVVSNEVEGTDGTAKFDINISVDSEKRSVHLEYRSRLWMRDTAKRFLDAFVELLRFVTTAEPTATECALVLRKIPIVRKQEQQRIERMISGQQVEYERIPLMHQFFEDAVDRHPDFVALKLNDIEMTYQQVEDHANQLARYLVNELGVKVEDCIGVLFPRGFEMIIALLAILKAGGAYVPLDENYPKSRIDQIVSDSRMKICLTTRLGMDGVLLRNVEGCGIALEDIEESVFKQSCARLDTVKVSTSNLAYVLYTSGSTGKPKGVEIEHGNVGNFGQHYALRCWQEHQQQQEVQEQELLVARLSWDVSVGSMMRAFSHSGVLCLLAASIDVSSELESIIVRQRITHMFATPSVLALLHPASVMNLREVNSGGNRLTTAVLKCWTDHGIVITNSYGPTEATVVTHHAHTANDGKHGVSNVPFGYALNNNGIRVLDQHGMTQPQGVVGELYIGGPQVARGYRNMPELTAKTFIKLQDDPLQRRWYKTGDLVRVLCDGQLEFMGRIANGYVKLRGYRIELGDIESVIEMHPNVANAAVIVDEERQSILAFVVLNTVVQDDGATIVSLRKQCVSKLTDYMIPHSFTILDEMPLDANGKLDKKALPALNFSVNQSTTGTQARDMPSNEMEQNIADIWSEVLGIPKGTLSLDDNFFTMGGHSLLVSRAVSVMREKVDACGDISTRDMYMAPTIRACCDTLAHYDGRFRTSTLVSESKRRRSTIILEERIEMDMLSGSKISDQTGLLKTARSTGRMSNLVLTFSLWFIFIVLLGLCLYPSVWIVLQVPLSSGLGLMFVILPYLVGASISFVTLLTLLTLIVKWGLVGRLQPGKIQAYSRRYAAWWLFDRLWMLYQTLVASMFCGTIYLPRILNWFGARIGTGVFLENLSVRCPDMIEIGDGSMIESDVILHVIEFEQGTEDVILGGIKIGAHCVLGAGSFVESNSVVGPRCMVAPLCHMPQNCVLESDCRVSGTLAARETLKTELPDLDWGTIDLEVGKEYKHPVWDHAASTSYWLHSVAPFVVQLPGVIVMLGYYLVIGLFASTLNTSRTIPVLIAIVSKPMLDFVLMIVVSVLVRIVRELLLLGENGKPGTCAVFSTSFYRRWIASELYRKTAARYYGTMLSRMCTKIQGGDAELSSEFSLEPMEPKLTTCGTGFFAANGTQLRNVSFRREGLVEFGRIDIGNNCMVLDRSVVLPGSVLGDFVTVGALSVVDRELKPGSLLFGNPPIIREVRGVKRPTPKTSLLIAGLTLVLNTYALWIFSVLPITGVFVGLLSAVRIGSSGLTSSESEAMGFLVYIVSFPVLLAFWGVFQISISLCCKWLLVGKFEASAENSRKFKGALGAEFGSLRLLQWQFCNGFIHATGKLVIQAIDNPSLTRWYMRAMGAEIADDAWVDSSAFFLEADMLSIESGAKIGPMATMFCHSFENGVLEFKQVQIGKDADVGSRSVVLPGSIVGESVKLLPLTHVMPEECFRAGCTYGGSPAERVET